jgi:hypothetical protein
VSGSNWVRTSVPAPTYTPAVTSSVPPTTAPSRRTTRGDIRSRKRCPVRSRSAVVSTGSSSASTKNSTT